MSLEAALHERWSQSSALEALLPAARLTSGLAADDVPLPYAVLQRGPIHARWHTSTRTVEEIELELHVYAERLETLGQLATALREAFDRRALASDEGDVLRMRVHQRHETQHDDGIWHLDMRFRVLLALAAPE
jgi:hypothetical protein